MVRKAEITMAKVDHVASHLETLPEVTPEKKYLTIREAVSQLKPQISILKSKGYTIEQIADELSKAGIAIKPSTLKLYSKGVKKAKSSRQPKEPVNATTLHTKTEDKLKKSKQDVARSDEVASEAQPKGKFTPTDDTSDI